MKYPSPASSSLTVTPVKGHDQLRLIPNYRNIECFPSPYLTTKSARHLYNNKGSKLKKNARLRLSSGVSRKHKDSRGDKNKHREEILDPNSYWYNKE